MKLAAPLKLVMDQHLPAEVYAIPALWEICIVGVTWK